MANVDLSQEVIDTLDISDVADVSLITIDFASAQETYQLCDIGVIRQSDSAQIPDDPGNQDWVEYQKWLTLGLTPIPATVDPPPTLQDRRWQLYPSVQDQLDALYQARQGNPQPLADIDSKITAINQSIPK